MAGLGMALAYMAGGGAEGVGSTLVDQAKARREEALRRLELEGARSFATSERIASQDFELEKAKKLREMDLQDGAGKAPEMKTLYDDKGQEYQAQWNPSTRTWDRVGGSKAASKPSGVQEYEYAKEQGFKGTFQDWEASKKGGMSLTVDPVTGEVSFQQGGNIKPLTEGQSKDATYSTRAEGALPIIDSMGEALTSLPQSMGAGLPVVGNYTKTKEYQQAEQAGNEFLQAVLRKDTGAAITSNEMAEYGSVYLPRPGDGPELLEQKKQSRRRALAAMKAGMTPQAILAQERALISTGDKPAPTTNKPSERRGPMTIDGYTIEEVN